MCEGTSLELRSVVLTGGRTGIGEALTYTLADRFNVYRIGRYLEHADEGRIHSRPGDVRHPHVIDGVMREAAKGGRLAMLVNCAGVIFPRPVAELDAAEVIQEIATNLTGTILATAAFLTHSSGPRIVVMVASTSGLRPSPGWPVYGATKAAMINFGRSLASENPDINVVTIAPGRTATGLRRRIAPDEDQSTIMQPETVAAFTMTHIECALEAGEQVYSGGPLEISGVV